MPGPDYHAFTHRPEALGGTDPLDWGLKIYAIEVFEVLVPVVTGDRAFEWEIPEDVDGAQLVKVEGYLNNAGSGSTQVQLRNQTQSVDLLSTKITIDSGEIRSKDAAVQPVVDEPNAIVNHGDMISVDVDAAAAGATGMGVIASFLPARLAGLLIQGAQGEPGGVTGWTGTFPGGSGASGTPGGAGSSWVTATGYDIGDVVLSGGTYYVATANHTSGALTQPGVGANWATVWAVLSYTEGESVSNGGTSYVAIVTHTATTVSEPGVGADWEDFWQVLSEHNITSAIVLVVNGNGLVIDTGVKGHIEVPFNCEIFEVIMLADQIGSATIDVWKDTYANYPPINADSITAATPPTITSALKSVDSTLSGWNTTINAGDILAFNVDSCTLITRLTISLKVHR